MATITRNISFSDLKRTDAREADAITFFAPSSFENSPRWGETARQLEGKLFDRTRVEWSSKHCLICHNTMFVYKVLSDGKTTRLKCTCGRSVDVKKEDLENEKMPAL